jgi:hypothetical protein
MIVLFSTSIPVDIDSDEKAVYRVGYVPETTIQGIIPVHTWQYAAKKQETQQMSSLSLSALSNVFIIVLRWMIIFLRF